MWIEKLPNGKFKYFERYKDPYTEKDRRVSVTLNSKSNQAKKQALAELQEKIDAAINKPKSKNITFQEAVDLFIVDYEKKVKQSSFVSFKSSEKTIIATAGPETLIKNIDSTYLRTKIEYLYYDKGYSLNYAKKIKAYIIRIMEFAKNSGFNATPPYFKLNLTPRQEISTEKYLEKDEVRKLVKQLNSYAKNQRKADMVEFMVLTGLRYGELIALREEDLYEGYIKVTGTIDFRSGHYSEVIRTTPKTKAAYRNISLPNRGIEIIIKILQENYFLKSNKSYIDRGYIFTNPKGMPIDYRTFAPALKNAAKKAGISKPVTSHYLRHTHISFLAELNIPIKVVMERVGHTDASTTLQVYTHVTNKMKDNLVDKLNKITF
jgi:integrase